MNMFEALAYLLLPAVVIIGVVLLVTRYFKFTLSKRAYWSGVIGGVLVVGVVVALVFMRWANPDAADYRKPIYDLVLLPPGVLLAVALLAIRVFKLRVSPSAFLSGCVSILLSASVTGWLLNFYFSG